MWIQVITCLLICSDLGHSDTTKFPRPYQFGYTVNDKTTGDFKSHHEVNDGKEVRGRYSLVEPTGDLRVVTYTADRSNGYRAVVSVEPRTQTQPTSTYHLVKLQPRQQDEPTDATAAPVTREDDGQGHTTPQELKRRNNTGIEQSMAVVNDYPIMNKNILQSENKLGNRGEAFDVNQFNTEHLNNAGPQIIPVKIEEISSEIASEIQEPVLKVEVTSINPTSTEQVENVNVTQVSTTQKFGNHNKNTAITPNSQIKTQNNDQTSLDGSHMKNNTDEQSVIKSMIELQFSNSDKGNPTLQPSLENLLTTLDYFRTSQPQTLQTTNPDLLQNTPLRAKENEEISKINNSTLRVTSNNKGMTTTDLKQNNMMLAALLLPTTPILKFTCTPDHSDKKNIAITPTMSNSAPMISQRSPQPISLGPGGSVFTPSIPLLPFQIVNFSPIKQIFTAPQNNKFTPQKPLSFFATKPPFVTAFSTALFQNKDSVVTVAPEQKTNTPHKDEDALVKVKPPNGYTNLRTEGSTSQAHKVQSSHYTHHLLPPPWAPHPLRPLHNSHYRHMPIFVLPMSHNFNFAPTFDPALLEQHNH